MKRPRNATTHCRGTRADFERQATKLEAGATTMLKRHRAIDAVSAEPDSDAKMTQRVQRLEHGDRPTGLCDLRHNSGRIASF